MRKEVVTVGHMLGSNGIILIRLWQKLYDTIEEILEEDGKGDTNVIVLGDWKNAVGDETYRNIVGSHGLG